MANEMNYEPFECLGLTKKVTEAITDALGKDPELVQDAIDALDLMPEDEEGSFKYKNYRALIRTACKEIGADVPRKKYKRIEDEAEHEKPKLACKIFNCDLMNGNYCCFYCVERYRCNNPCLNDPKKCKQFIKHQLTEY